MDGESETLITHALRADDFAASEDGTGRGTPLIPIQGACGNEGANGDGIGRDGDPMFTLDQSGSQAIAFHARQDPDSGPVTHPLDTDGSSIGIQQGWRVRRPMPLECERLMGTPDGYTAISYRGKLAADGPRYRSLGNSMAVPCMAWLGRRIALVDRP